MKRERRVPARAGLVPAVLMTVGLAVFALSAGGCATGVTQNRAYDASTRGDPSAATQIVYVEDGTFSAVQVLDTGWSAKDGYVHLGMRLSNPNEDAAAFGTVVRVVLFDEAGDVMSTTDETIAVIGPGEVIGWSDMVGDGWVPARVEASVVVGSTRWQAADEYEQAFTVENAEEQDKLYYRYEVTGTVTNHTVAYVSTIRLSVLMCDEDGAIVSGYAGNAYRVKSGQSKSYLLTMNAAPEHARVEVYAQPS